jgi:hypothetical protein
MIYQNTRTKANEREKTIAKVLTIVVIASVSPMLLIWAINALFPAAAIALTVKTWFAAFVVIACTRRAAGK